VGGGVVGQGGELRVDPVQPGGQQPVGQLCSELSGVRARELVVALVQARQPVAYLRQLPGSDAGWRPGGGGDQAAPLRCAVQERRVQLCDVPQRLVVLFPAQGGAGARGEAIDVSVGGQWLAVGAGGPRVAVVLCQAEVPPVCRRLRYLDGPA
jgi:hypothetical protein